MIPTEIHDQIRRARQLAAELLAYSSGAAAPPEPRTSRSWSDSVGPLDEFDRRIRDADLRAATRTRFDARHFADAIEAGVKVLNEVVRARTGLKDDGDSLMTVAFSPNAPLLRLNQLRSKSETSEQRGHMMLCQGVVGAWRNPRAHSLVDDSPRRALMMLETIDDLITVTRSTVRTRKR